MNVCEGAGPTLRLPIHAVCIHTAGPSSLYSPCRSWGKGEKGGGAAATRM